MRLNFKHFLLVLILAFLPFMAFAQTPTPTFTPTATPTFVDNLRNWGSAGAYAAYDNIGDQYYVPRVKIVTGADGVVNGDISSSSPLPSDPVTQTVTGSAALTVTAGAYSAGYNVGGLKTFTSMGRAGANGLTVQSIAYSDKGAKGKNVSVIIFNANPTGTTFTDDAALTIADADLPKIACVIPITTHVAFADNGISTANNIGCAVDLGSGTSLYAAVIAGEAVTYGATGDINLSVTVYQD